MDGQYEFRTALFGGFKRKDVISYIQKLLTELDDCKRAIAEQNRVISEQQPVPQTTPPTQPEDKIPEAKDFAVAEEIDDEIVSARLHSVFDEDKIVVPRASEHTDDEDNDEDNDEDEGEDEGEKGFDFSGEEEELAAEIDESDTAPEDTSEPVTDSVLPDDIDKLINSYLG